jgi:hypothetical protein
MRKKNIFLTGLVLLEALSMLVNFVRTFTIFIEFPYGVSRESEAGNGSLGEVREYTETTRDASIRIMLHTKRNLSFRSTFCLSALYNHCFMACHLTAFHHCFHAQDQCPNVLLDLISFTLIKTTNRLAEIKFTGSVSLKSQRRLLRGVWVWLAFARWGSGAQLVKKTGTRRRTCGTYALPFTTNDKLACYLPATHRLLHVSAQYTSIPSPTDKL